MDRSDACRQVAEIAIAGAHAWLSSYYWCVCRRLVHLTVSGFYLLLVALSSSVVQ